MNVTTQPLDAGALRAALVGPWAQLDVVERTGSTNADLLAAATAGARDRTVLVAEYQEAGRGRMTRSWVSPPGTGLTVSVLLRPVGVPASRFGWLPLLTGLAVLDTVRRFSSAPAGLKWPNDVLIGEREPRKVAGILAEVADARGPAVVIGIGMNVGATPPDQPFATSLAAEGARVERHAVLVALLTNLAEREAQLARGSRRPGTHPAARGLPRGLRQPRLRRAGRAARRRRDHRDRRGRRPGRPAAAARTGRSPARGRRRRRRAPAPRGLTPPECRAVSERGVALTTASGDTV